MWEPLGSLLPRAMLRLYAQGLADTVTGTAVNQLLAALEAVVSLAEVGRPAEDTVDCKH